MTSCPDVHFTHSDQSWGFWRCPDHGVPNAGVCHMCQEVRRADRPINSHYRDPSFYPSSLCHAESLALFWTPPNHRSPLYFSNKRRNATIWVPDFQCQASHPPFFFQPSFKEPKLNLNHSLKENAKSWICETLKIPKEQVFPKNKRGKKAATALII